VYVPVPGWQLNDPWMPHVGPPPSMSAMNCT
jgi:hypothetical protein